MHRIVRQPLSYRHGFHAGNHGDVLKHVVLTQLIGSTLRNCRNRQVIYVDTHSGPGGVYKVDSDMVRKKNEFASAAGRIHDLARLAIRNQIPPSGLDQGFLAQQRHDQTQSRRRRASRSRLSSNPQPRLEATAVRDEESSNHAASANEGPHEVVPTLPSYQGELSLDLFAPSSDLYAGIPTIHGMPKLSGYDSILVPKTTAGADADSSDSDGIRKLVDNLERNVRELLPIPSELLPYLSVMFVANEPLKLDSVVESASMGKLRFEDREKAIANPFKLKTLEERARKRERENGGKFINRAGLSVETKALLMRAVCILGARPTESSSSADFTACDDMIEELSTSAEAFYDAVVSPSSTLTPVPKFDFSRGKAAIPVTRRQAQATVHMSDAMPATPFFAHSNPERKDLRAEPPPPRENNEEGPDEDSNSSSKHSARVKTASMKTGENAANKKNPELKPPAPRSSDKRKFDDAMVRKELGIDDDDLPSNLQFVESSRRSMRNHRKRAEEGGPDASNPTSNPQRDSSSEERTHQNQSSPTDDASRTLEHSERSTSRPRKSLRAQAKARQHRELNTCCTSAPDWRFSTQWPQIEFTSDLWQQLVVKPGSFVNQDCLPQVRSTRLLPSTLPTVWTRSFSAGRKASTQGKKGGNNAKARAADPIKKSSHNAQSKTASTKVVSSEEMNSRPRASNQSTEKLSESQSSNSTKRSRASMSKRQLKKLKWARQKAKMRQKQPPKVKRPSNRVDILAAVGLDRKQLKQQRLAKKRMALLSDVELEAIRKGEKVTTSSLVSILEAQSSTAFCLFGAPGFLPLQKGAKTALRALPSSPFIFHSLMNPLRDQVFFTELHSTEYMALLDHYINYSLSQKLNAQDRRISARATQIALGLPPDAEIGEDLPELFDEDEGAQRRRFGKTLAEKVKEIQESPNSSRQEEAGVKGITDGRPVVTEREFLRIAAAEVGWAYLTPERENALRLKFADELKQLNLRRVKERQARRDELKKVLTNPAKTQGRSSENQDYLELLAEYASNVESGARLPVDVIDALLQRTPGVVVLHKDGPNFLQRLSSFVASEKQRVRQLPQALLEWTKPKMLHEMYQKYVLTLAQNKLLAENVRAFETYAAAEIRFAESLAAALRTAPTAANLKAARPGLVLIDPAYEGADEYVSALEALRTTRNLWPEAQVAVWYPILNPEHPKAQEDLDSGDHTPVSESLRKAEIDSMTHGSTLYSNDLDGTTTSANIASNIFANVLRTTFRRTPRVEQRALFLEIATRMIKDQQLRLRQHYATLLLDQLDTDNQDNLELYFDHATRSGIRKRQVQLARALLELPHDTQYQTAGESESDLLPAGLQEASSVCTITAELRVRNSPVSFTCGSGMFVVNPMEPKSIQGQLTRTLPWLTRALRDLSPSEGSKPASYVLDVKTL